MKNSKFDILISQLYEHNDIEIMLVKKYNVKKIVMICNDRYRFLRFKENFNVIFPDCTVIEEEIGAENEVLNLNEIIKKYKDKKIIINLTGGKRLISLMLLKSALEENIDSIYVDLLREKRYILNKDSRIIHEKLNDIAMGEIINLGDNTIISDSCNLSSKKEIIEITEKILENLEMWNKYKYYLSDMKIFNHDHKDPYKVFINIEIICKEEVEILVRILRWMEKKKIIKYVISNNLIQVQFKNYYLKGFIFKSGTWLEVLTYNVVKEINEISEARNGVVFAWEKEIKKLQNELDVVAVKNSNLICISCKDSDKYDEKALNELSIYAERLGGERVKKILVSTKLPLKNFLMERAKEMDIDIVIVHKNIEEFKKRLIYAIDRI